MNLRGVKPWIRAITPYQPGKPPEEVVRALGIADAVNLASNENPLGPSKRVVDALCEAAGQAHRYPDDENFALRKAVAERLEVLPGQLVFGNGSDEVLELIAKTFLGPEDDLLFAWPSFAMYPLVARGMGARPVQAPLDAALAHDLDALRAAVCERTRVVIICNPNNPTGSSVGAAAFDRFAESLPEDLLLVVDEAYFEYVRRADFPDALSWVSRRPGTVVLRTFSKFYGLAGLRIGYGVCDAELADLLGRARHPFNVNALAARAATVALDDLDHQRRTREQNAQGMALLERELGALGVRSWPSDANFLLVESGVNSYEALLRRGVIVRPMDAAGLSGCVRVTVGKPEENECFLKALQAVREGQT